MALLGIDKKIEHLGDEVREGVREGLKDAWRDLLPKAQKEIDNTLIDADHRIENLMQISEGLLRSVIADMLLDAEKRTERQIEQLRNQISDLEVTVKVRSKDEH